MTRSEKIMETELQLMTAEHRGLEHTIQYRMLDYELSRLKEEGAIGTFLAVMALVITVPLLPITIFLLCMFDCGLKNYFKLLKQGYTNLYELGVCINK